MTATSDKLSCYNRGCNKSFTIDDNGDSSCVFHPGTPVFHDALKGWSCCEKRVTDFSDFLNLKGCSTGPHSNKKPETPPEAMKEAAKLRDESSGQTVVNRAPIDNLLARERPPKTPSVRLAVQAFDKHKALVQKAKEELLQAAEAAASQEVPIGELCKNKACGKAYEGSASDKEHCLNHSGEPVFHEGLKFWSCCEKKTHDFDVFLNQAGCTTAENHMWFKVDETAGGEIPMRYDFHQTGDSVNVAVFCKLLDASLCSVDLSPIELRIHAVNAAGSYFNLSINLHAAVRVEDSSARVLGTKLEVMMKKLDIESWPRLEYIE